MRLSDAVLHRRRTKALNSSHRLPPWLTEDVPRDRPNRLLDHALDAQAYANDPNITGPQRDIGEDIIAHR
jgi:hypothetical protein